MEQEAIQQSSPERCGAAQATPICPACGSSSVTVGGPVSWSSYIYALGRIEPRFPSLALEKEYAQLVGHARTDGLTDQQIFHAVLRERNNRYLARQLCWVFTVEGYETYILVPRDPVDLDSLIASVRPVPRVTDLDVVIGMQGPKAPPDICNGLTLPIVKFDQLYSFDVDALIKALPRPEDVSEEEAAPVAQEVLWRVMHMTDNKGEADDHRALNYLAVRYPGIYSKTAEQFRGNCSLTGVEVRATSLTGVRKIVNVIFSFTNRTNDVTDKFFVRVDVTEEFPFLVTKLSPYYDH